jgi:two-component system, LuxR family, sensor kinase FixL
VGEQAYQERPRADQAPDTRPATIVERAASPACVLDPTGRIVAANRQLEALLDAGDGGLRGRWITSLTYPPDAELTRTALGAIFQQGFERHQVDKRTVGVRGQELVWATWDLSPVRDTRGRPRLAIAMIRDLTQAARAEQERRFFEYLLRLIGEAEDSEAVLAAAVQTICHFTRCGMGQAWVPAGDTLICASAWYSSWYGFQRLRLASERVSYPRGAGLPGLAWATGQPQHLRDVAADEFDRAGMAVRAGVREAMAVPIQAESGLVAVLEFFVTQDRAGEPGRLERIERVVGQLGPLIERKRAEEALRVSEERFRGVTDAATDAIVSADGEGLLRSWNRGAERMFGWRAEEVVGRPVALIMPERFRALHAEGLARVRRTGHSKLAGSVVELVGLRRDGTEFPVELSVGVWESPDGPAFSGVLRDITERKRAEEALAATSRELERTNAELETLVYSASHDLKSPMVSLLGYLEYLRIDYGDALGREGGRYLERMTDCTLYMQRLIHDLIDLSRVGRAAGEVTDVDLGELVGAIVEEVRAAHPSVGFHVGRLPVVVADPVGLRQLFTNLIENAVRHGGRPDLEVTVEGRELLDGSLELSVRDDGRGIPPEHRERVFGVFERLDGPSTAGGTGMGLAICRKIVELLHGSIRIQGTDGTDVRVNLPAGLQAHWPRAAELAVVPLHDQGALT